MPIKQILGASVDDFKPDDKARFYAWSWQLVHLLINSPDDRRRLDRYLSLYASGLGSVDAARAAFGDLAGLESRMLSHTADPRGSSAMKVDLGADTQVPVTALGPEAAQLLDARLLRIAGGNRKAALSAVSAFVAAYPSNAEGRLELALAQKDSNLAEARSSALTAMSLAPGSARALAIWSDIAFRQLKANPASMPRDWDKIRNRLADAIGPDVQDPMVLALLFRSYLAEPRRPTVQAIAAMDKALTLQPESYELRSLGVYSLALSGKMNQARRAARILASDPHAGELGKRAMATLDKIGTGKVSN
jgi:tetratricopeptide (TPR) repeat protein